MKKFSQFMSENASDTYTKPILAQFNKHHSALTHYPNLHERLRKDFDSHHRDYKKSIKLEDDDDTGRSEDDATSMDIVGEHAKHYHKHPKDAADIESKLKANPKFGYHGEHDIESKYDW